MGIAKEDLIKALGNAFDTKEGSPESTERLVTESTRCDGHNYASLVKLHDREDFEQQAYAENQDAYMIKDVINCLKEKREVSSTRTQPTRFPASSSTPLRSRTRHGSRC